MGLGNGMASGSGRKTFRLVLVKPSHYDDDGYVIQWLRSPIPANSLACLYGLAQDASERQALGADIALDVTAIDETNTRLRPERIAREVKAADHGVVMLVGVQSNQFPRALHIAQQLRDQGVTVGIGGFHVSGTLAMLPNIEPNVQRALDMGCFIYAGEAEEGRLDLILKDALNDRLQPIYNFMKDLPGIAHVPTPHLPASVIKRTYGANTSFDAGRGCPFQCSFCTIINVQGRKSRRRSPDDVETIVRANAKQNIFHFFITDDNFARNKDWEAIFDRLIHLREVEKINIKLIIQVDTLCHRIPNFIEKAARAGVKRVFIGLENVSPDNLQAAKKKQNKITEYRMMLLAWKKVGVLTYCGYILGFPNDTPERIKRDIEVIKRELPVDLLEFFYLTPLPGSEDHKIRPQPRLHGASDHVQGGVGPGLPRGLGDLLLGRPCRDDPAPRRRHQRQRRQDHVRAQLVHRLDPHRGHPPPRGRLRAPQAPARPAARSADGIGVELLPALRRRADLEAGALALAHLPHAQALQVGALRP